MMRRIKDEQQKSAGQAKKGQGVIEYAGAIVVAAVLVAAMLALGPDGIAGIFNTVIQTVENTLTATLASL